MTQKYMPTPRQSELIRELQAAVLVYEDIIGAMNNGEPYTLEELTSPAFVRNFEKARALLDKAVAEPAEEPTQQQQIASALHCAFDLAEDANPDIRRFIQQALEANGAKALCD